MEDNRGGIGKEGTACNRALKALLQYVLYYCTTKMIRQVVDVYLSEGLTVIGCAD